MEDRKKELLKKIATEFPALKESEKYYIAGYISHAEDTRVEKMEVRDFLDSEIKPDLEVELKESLKKIQQSAQRTQKKGDR